MKAWQRSRWIARLFSLGCILTLTAGYLTPLLEESQAQTTTPPFIQDELLIKLKPNLPPQAVQAVLNRLQAKPLERLNSSGWVRVKLMNKQVVGQMSANARQLPEVVMAEPNYIVHADVIPNDPSFNQLWGLNHSGNADTEAAAAWDTFKPGGNRVVVAVIDSGVDYTHADLTGRIWTNPKEIPGNRIDDDQNGYVDDVRGWDFVNNDADPMDDYNHGTHVAGTIAATYNNNVGITGIAGPAEVRIMPLKFLNNQGSGSTANAIKALDYATANGAVISNNSWGGGSFSQALQDALTRNHQAGALFVASAGNNSRNTDSSPYYPQSYNVPNVISVASITSGDALSSFSNYGVQSVDIAAPGSNIYSTVPGGYRSFNGTSMAAPHVAGALATMWAQNYTLTNLQAKQIMMNTSRKAGYLTNNVACGGSLNLKNALAYTGTPGTPPPPPPAEPDPPPAPPPSTPVPAPKAPSNLSGSPVLEQRNRYAIRYAKLTWNDNSNNETGFEIWMAESPNGPFKRIKVAMANVTTWTDEIGRKPMATDIYYKIRAKNLSGVSDYTNTIKINKF